MSILSTSVKFIRKAAVLMLLSLLASSCQWITDDYDDETAGSSDTNYIKLTLHVRASAAVTRANPTGGEDGDGREKGIETRENKVDGVTVIFYQNAAGINASAESAAATPIDFVAYYETKADGNAYDRYSGELCYTTDEQELDASLDITKTYHILVVANADLTGSITTGNAATTSLADVRDMMQISAYTGSGVAVDASKFVMTSESNEDDVISFHYSTYDKTTNRRIYTFDNIHIERMAARIDFWAKNANGYKTSTDDTRYATPGYEYTVKKADGTDSGDRFVLTRITPFNLNAGNEYLLKRTNDPTSPYLHDETTTNWVTDPYTSAKNGTSHPDHLVSKLADVVTTFENGYTVAMAAKHAGATAISGSENFTLCYTKENTLRTDGTTPLFYYATGLAFEGFYYATGETTGTRRVYYHFIRHQGEGDAAYSAWTTDDINDAKTTLCPASPAMNYGIVRNNIYRISIDQITEDARIKVKMWDVFTHSAIYM